MRFALLEAKVALLAVCRRFVVAVVVVVVIIVFHNFFLSPDSPSNPGQR